MHTDSVLSVRLWYTRAEQLSITQQQSCLARLPEAQQRHFLTLRSDKRRQEYLFSRLLICTALSQVYSKPPDSWVIQDRPHAKPEIANLPASVYISLSHSRQLIGFALSEAPIGLDIEYRAKRNNLKALAAEFMTLSELNKLPPVSSKQHDFFYRLWCAKEAVYKALPRDRQLNTPLSTIDYAALAAGDTNWQLHEHHIGAFQSSLVTPRLPTQPSLITRTLQLV